MTEISCQNCKAACCKGTPLIIMQLTEAEHRFMEAGDNVLQAIATPVDHDREDVIYPVEIQINPDRSTLNWLVEPSRQYEPLKAGYGRYALAGACKYLIADDDGWEHCGAYEERPEVCATFEMGGDKCQTLRILRSVDPPIG